MAQVGTPREAPFGVGFIRCGGGAPSFQRPLGDTTLDMARRNADVQLLAAHRRFAPGPTRASAVMAVATAVHGNAPSNA